MATKPVTDFHRILGQRVRQIRLELGMSPDDFCHRCGIGKTYLFEIEVGHANPTLTMLAAIAGTLGCYVYELFIEDPTVLAILMAPGASS